jgi:hypothetical protein
MGFVRPDHQGNGRSSAGFVADGFNVVPIGASDERTIVVGMVARAQAGRTVVFPTCFERRTVERIDLLAILRDECKMKMRRLLLGLLQPQGRFAVSPEAATVRAFHYNSHTKRMKCLQEKRLARRIVAGSESDMIKHGCAPRVFGARPDDQRAPARRRSAHRKKSKTKVDPRRPH